jgi:hypothetical protein
VNVRSISKNEAQRRKYKKLKLGGGQTYDGSVSIWIRHNLLHRARTDRPGMYIVLLYIYIYIFIFIYTYKLTKNREKCRKNKRKRKYINIHVTQTDCDPLRDILVRGDAPRQTTPKVTYITYGHESQKGARSQNGRTDW